VFGCIADFASKLKRGISQYCVKENLEQATIPDKDIMNLVDQNINIDGMEQDSVSNSEFYVVSVKSDAAFHHTIRDRSTLTADLTYNQVKEGVTTISSRLATAIPFAGFFIAGLIATFFTQDGLYRTIAEIILAGVLIGVIIISDFYFYNNIIYALIFQQLFFITIAVLMLVCSPIVIIALVENLTLPSVIAEATVGDYGQRAVTVMVGVISGAAVTILFDTRVATTCVRMAVNYTHFLLITSVIFQVIFGIHIFISIMATTAGAYVGAAIFVGIIGSVLRASSKGDMVTTVSKAIAFGAFIGASIGALMGTVSGALIGSIVGAIIISESDIITAVLVKICIPIEPYSISIRLVALPIRAVLKILGPIANIGFITSRRNTVFRVVGAIIGAAIGAHTGVIGGACIGITISGFAVGTLTGGAILIFESGFHQQVVAPTLKSIGTFVDVAVLFIFAGIVSVVVLSTVCALASSYFITSAIMGKFGPYVSYFIGNIIALSEAITGDLASSGFTGGLLGGIAVGIYRTKAANNLHVTEFEVYALGAIGAITGFITTRVDEAIGDAPLKITAGTPFGDAALGAFSGLFGGALLVIVKVPMETLTETAITKVGGLIVTITAVIGGVIGGILGGYFSISVVFAGLLGIAFSVISMVILTAVITVRQTRNIRIPLKDIIVLFGEAIRSKSDKGNAVNNNRVQYKIKCQ
jgi:hypothetical protein